MKNEEILCPCLGEIRLKSILKDDDGNTIKINVDCTCERKGFIKDNELFYNWGKIYYE